MTQALPSLLSEPSAANEIRFVRGPPDLAKTVNSLVIITHLRHSLAPAGGERPNPAYARGRPGAGDASRHRAQRLAVGHPPQTLGPRPAVPRGVENAFLAAGLRLVEDTGDAVRETGADAGDVPDMPAIAPAHPLMPRSHSGMAMRRAFSAPEIRSRPDR